MINLIKNLAQITNCPEGSDSASCLTSIPSVPADGASLTEIMSIVFGIISAITVIIIIVQGIKFILSSGEPEKAASARKGIIYALIGLTISVSANLIVVFILKDLL